MSYFINNQQHLNDVIFSGRNKNYGAYAIRSAYGNTLFKSLFLVASGFGTFMGLAFYFSNPNDLPPQKSDVPFYQDSTITTVFHTKPEESARNTTNREPLPPARTETPENSVVSISDSVSVETHTALNQVTDPNLTGTTTGSVGNEALATSTGSTGGGASGLTASDDPAELYFVDKEPEFEGGLPALYKFISSNLRYPALASDEGKQGTIYVKFVVNENGKVEKVSLQNNLGYGLDDEAKRVVSLIPDFKSPAKVKGRAVKVYFQLPIRFRLH